MIKIKTQINSEPLAKSRIRSPQAPADLEPVPYEQKSVGEIGLTPSVIKTLNGKGIYVLPDLDAFLSGGGDLTDFDGIGDKTAEKIEGLLEAYNE